jgi:SAM-dependent methyltransferase
MNAVGQGVLPGQFRGCLAYVAGHPVEEGPFAHAMSQAPEAGLDVAVAWRPHMTDASPYYRPDLAWVHHQVFGVHAKVCAAGVIELLEPVRRRNGLVVEIGCGSGLLTTELIGAGHRVVATDASPAMLHLARERTSGAEDIRRLTLPDDPVPRADAIVGVGHALNYLADADAINRALLNMAAALAPGGVLAVDVCDLEWGAARQGAGNLGRVGDDWAIISHFSTPSPDRFVREMTTFVRNADGSWRRDDERHDNVLVDTALLPAFLATAGVSAEIRDSFGTEQLPAGLRVLVGRKS